MTATALPRSNPEGRPLPLGTRRRIALPAAKRPISGTFQLLLALYILLTGEVPTIVQAIAFGLQGSAVTEFSIAMLTALALDVLLIGAVAYFAGHPLGILHPLLLAVVVWPLMAGAPTVIQQFGGWAGVLAGNPLAVPFYAGLPTHSASNVWLAIAKYNGLQLIALVSIYAGFFAYRRDVGGRIPNRHWDSGIVKSILIGLLGVSIVVLLLFIYSRGGLAAHLASLGLGRFRQLQNAGVAVVITDLGAIALYLWVAARPTDVKTPMFIASMLVVVASQFISNGSRGSAMIVPLFVAMIWAIRMQRIPWRMAFLLAPILFLSLGFLSAIRTSSWEGSTASEAFAKTSWSDSFALADRDLQARRSVSSQVPIAARGFQASDGPLLGRSYLAAVFAAIPRTMWEEKPRGPDSLYAQIFLGEQREGRAIPVGPTAEQYWNFGIPGLILLSLIYGALLRAAYLAMWRRYPNPFWVVFYVLFVTGFQFATRNLVDFQQEMGLLLFSALVVNFLAGRRQDAPLQAISPRMAARPSHP